jgi:hypothetical protein
MIINFFSSQTVKANVIFNHRVLLIVSIVFCSFFLSNNILAQTSNGADSTWILKSDNNGVKTYYQPSNCNNNFVFLLKFENSNDSDITATWQQQVSKSENASMVTTVISARQTLNTTCEQSPIIVLQNSSDNQLPISMLEAVDLLVINIQSK